MIFISTPPPSTGNPEILDDISQNTDFSYVRILRMMYSRNEEVRVQAGSALAAFAYNSLPNQKQIAEQGGIRFTCFVPFLQSEDEYFRCQAAFQVKMSSILPRIPIFHKTLFRYLRKDRFVEKGITDNCSSTYHYCLSSSLFGQVVVLARIIPDEEQAISSAAGIKLLVDIIQDSKSERILALAADCIARLAHTRAGRFKIMIVHTHLASSMQHRGALYLLQRRTRHCFIL